MSDEARVLRNDYTAGDGDLKQREYTTGRRTSGDKPKMDESILVAGKDSYVSYAQQHFHDDSTVPIGEDAMKHIIPSKQNLDDDNDDERVDGGRPTKKKKLSFDVSRTFQLVDGPFFSLLFV